MEREIIEMFLKHLTLQGELPLGDDAGALRIGEEWLVATNDMLVRKTDVPEIMTPEQTGFKAVTMNVSDIAAMGAEPIAFLFSIGIPSDSDMEYLEGIARGIGRGSEFYGIPVISADTNEACDLIIDGIALGKTAHLLRRDGAKPGDLVCVTGDIGRALAGLKVYSEGIEVDGKTRKALYEKLLEPRARVREGLMLGPHASSAIDISDGLSKEIHLLAEMSGVRMIIDSERLPVRDEVFEVAGMLGMDPLAIALASGEEFELLFTIPQSELRSIDFEFSVIGEVKEGSGVYILRNGVPEEMPVLGWEHLGGRSDGNLHV